jgi:hypothetical protein
MLKSLPHDPAARGYCVVYRENQVNIARPAGGLTGISGASRPNAASARRPCHSAEASSRGSGTHSRGHRPIFLDEVA